MSLDIKKFGKFRLLKQIARGGMAEIFLGSTGGIENAHKFVVIKRISLGHSHSNEFKKMFQNEGKIAINLNHGNIGALYEFGLEGDQYFICMEYISGRNLRQLVKKLKSQKKKLQIAFSAHIIKYVCTGLDYAHNCTDNITGLPLNIIHRDISPQNIMVSFSGDVKVIDFGIAKIDDSEATKVGVLKGKFEYMSPEQARGKNIDKHTDIFSLGNVLWELLAGRKLFIGDNELQLLRKIRECQIPDLKKLNPEVPDPLVSIVHKALSANKNLRHNTVAELGEELSIFLNKHYPDITNSKFSSFIKEVYAEEILDERNNLKLYSQALLQQSKSSHILPSAKHIQDDQLSTTPRSSTFLGYNKQLKEKEARETELEERADEANYDTGSLSLTNPDGDDNLGVSGSWTDVGTATETQQSAMTKGPETKTKIEDDDLLYSKSDISAKNPNYSIVDDQGHKTIMTSSINTKDGSLEGGEVPSSSPKYAPWSKHNRGPHNKKSTQWIAKSKLRQKRTRTFARLFIGVFVLGVSGVGGFVYLDEETKSRLLSAIQKKGQDLKTLSLSQADPLPIKPKMPVDITPNPEPIKPTGDEHSAYPEKREPSSIPPAYKTMTLTSFPSSAKVFSNGKSLDKLTPAGVSMSTQGPTKLILKKRVGPEQLLECSFTLNPNNIPDKMKINLKTCKRI